MPQAHQHWTERFRSSIPTQDALAGHPWLKPVAGRLRDPRLWRGHREAVARGVAVGTFWAFVIPFAQIIVAAAHCTWWRANIPVAAAMTMVTNPFTVGFWLWLAYQLGALVIGEPLHGAVPSGAGFGTWFEQYGWPTVTGMGLFAVGGAALGYASVKLVWRWRIHRKRRGRLGNSA